MLRSDWLSYYYAMCYSPLVAKSKTEFNIINFLALYWKCACVGPIFFKMHSQNVFISQEKKTDSHYWIC